MREHVDRACEIARETGAWPGSGSAVSSARRTPSASAPREKAPEGEPLYITVDTPDYGQKFADRIQVGIGGSDKEKGIDAAYQALSEPLISGYNGGFLREGATLSIIYLSDENDCSDRGALAAFHVAGAPRFSAWSGSTRQLPHSRL